MILIFKFTYVDLKNELDLSRQILGKERADISRKESKMGKKARVEMGMMEKTRYNFGARRQRPFSVVLGVKVRWIDSKDELRQRERTGYSQGSPQRSLLNGGQRWCKLG